MYIWDKIYSDVNLRKCKIMRIMFIIIFCAPLVPFFFAAMHTKIATLKAIPVYMYCVYHLKCVGLDMFPITV